MIDSVACIIMILILVFALGAAVYARKAAQTKPILVRELIVVVDTGADAEAVLRVLKDVMTVD